MARKPDPDARQRILNNATRLFAANGVRAVGLQQIIDECGCGKNLLYREFGSKDDLVAAFLDHCRQDWHRLVESVAAAHPGDPAGRLVAIVAAVAEQAVQDGFRGCPLRNAYSELPDDAAHPAHEVIRLHYTERQDHLRELARLAHAGDPGTLADRIALIIDGVNAIGPVMGKNGAVSAAVALAQEVVRAATP
jgi:AcrR family transcriptional regulator